MSKSYEQMGGFPSLVVQILILRTAFTSLIPYRTGAVGTSSTATEMLCLETTSGCLELRHGVTWLISCFVDL